MRLFLLKLPLLSAVNGLPVSAAHKMLARHLGRKYPETMSVYNQSAANIDIRKRLLGRNLVGKYLVSNV